MCSWNLILYVMLSLCRACVIYLLYCCFACSCLVFVMLSLCALFFLEEKVVYVCGKKQREVKDA